MQAIAALASVRAAGLASSSLSDLGSIHAGGSILPHI